MKKLFLFIFPLCVGFGIGHVVGYNREHPTQTKCPKDLTPALKGCELVAATINNALSECEYTLEKTEEARIRCVEIVKEVFEQQNGRMMRKP